MTDAAVFAFARPTGDPVNIRTIALDGEPWFVAVDVARALGLSLEGAGVIRHIGRLKAHEKHVARRYDEATVSLFDGAPNQAITLITESGLYKMAMRSDKDEALVFQDWIASEVLPSIRKTGKYALADHGREAMPLPMDIAESFAVVLERMDTEAKH